MFKVLITEDISKAGIDILNADEEIEVDYQPGIKWAELLEIIKDYDAIITRSGTPVNKELLDRAEKLKVVGRAGVGVDNIDLEETSKRGILVVNTPGANTIGAAEITMAHLYTVLRRLHLAHQSMLNGEWNRKKFMGEELDGKVVGIIGLGNVGTQVAIRCKAAGAKVIAYDPYIPREKGDKYGVQIIDDLHDLIKMSDIITLHCPLTEETRNMISKKEFELMKDGVYFINCARGGIVDEEALYEAIQKGKIAGLGLDVYSKEPPDDKIRRLFDFPNISLSPHIGANTYESQDNVAIKVAQYVIAALKGEFVEAAVNAPFTIEEGFEEIRAYLELSEKLGSFLTQYAGGHYQEIQIEVRGTIAKHLKPIVAYVLKGYLSPVLDRPVNVVNALFLAKERGINIIESTREAGLNFKEFIKITARNKDKEVSVGGTALYDKFPRIMMVDNYWIDIEPQGVILMFENKDVPGVIGKLGTLLARHNINIAGFRLGRLEKGKIALGALQLDDRLNEAVLEEIHQIPEIIKAKQVIL
ncbi:phosphoglycerate dehydrogenase [Venenivibrio stagnispumantis]|uniref:D-3-phosphoglycerate dehydrogenase n=1 Tax=Venenivibrio stagnispumantis TaxID=407998 RepID=A0AA46AD85_9AQUI|nr:phosphoglycerate dehydrogenase [Venenivibrio stagnispumantis]MCW4572433.1 phosphoglycerate dehydrogenase [Venenivibrio stagnispumantis]SMP03212.1 D-3-phosphoglycerate dehydrogenase [Venenivibrio stagnispumantis]